MTAYQKIQIDFEKVKHYADMGLSINQAARKLALKNDIILRRNIADKEDLKSIFKSNGEATKAKGKNQ